MSRLVASAGPLAAALVGLAVIRAFYGGHVLAPWNTAWMLRGTLGPDPVQYWLGWAFFRADAWRWPPGLNPHWGLEIGSAIFYADAIPLLAFLFKALRGVVAVDQYWGLWLYACGALQALLGWALMGRATRDPLARLAFAALLALQPMLLNRLGGHFALGGQWLLLAGLWLCLAPARGWRRGAAWAGLVGLASLIHAYLMPMVAALWVADWLARARRGPPWAEVPLVPGTGLAGLWLAGFFALRGGFGGTWGGYGEMQFDLLAWADPGPWGRFLPDLPHPDHAEAQDGYLGLGGLLLLAAGAAALAARGAVGRLRAQWPLLLVLGGLLALAVTPNLAVGGRILPLFALPEPVLDLADALRASTRFAWPVAYAALTGAALALAAALGGRRAGLVLAVLALVQALDLAPGQARLARYFPTDQGVAPLRLADPFWTEALRRHDRIRLLPTGMQAAHWEEVAVLAATHGRPTDAVYLARLDPAAVERLNAAGLARLAAGAPEPGSLYVLGTPAAEAAARRGMDPARDLLARVDGLLVFAPGWHAACLALGTAREGDPPCRSAAAP